MLKSCKHILLVAATLGGAFVGTPAQASCGADPFIGAICVMASNFCPRGYAPAAGQLLPISQNTALFSLLGTNFGGNGQTTFALPDLRGRSAVGDGAGPGLSPVNVGESGGQEQVSITANQMPAHSHSTQVRGTAATGNTDSPVAAVAARLPRSNIYSSGAADAAMGSSAVVVGSSGNGQPVPVRNPYLGLTHCIALQGIFPSRN